MFRYTRALALTIVIALGLGVAVRATASAQDSPSNDIPQTIPPGDPGDLDLTEEDERSVRGRQPRHRELLRLLPARR
ncbi:MAG: hypothetical protein ACI81L_003617 [Verrucomicrobiales bacterium]|jgi:hypothetical protein